MTCTMHPLDEDEKIPSSSEWIWLRIFGGCSRLPPLFNFCWCYYILDFHPRIMIHTNQYPEGREGFFFMLLPFSSYNSMALLRGSGSHCLDFWKLEARIEISGRGSNPEQDPQAIAAGHPYVPRRKPVLCRCHCPRRFIWYD